MAKVRHSAAAREADTINAAADEFLEEFDPDPRSRVTDSPDYAEAIPDEKAIVTFVNRI
jgi:hypothetical protein